MPESFVNIKLSPQEMDYLIKANFLKPLQIDAVRAAELANDSTAVLRLSRDSAEEFREAFTSELAKVGFGENYDVTPEGRILEDLIDRFYVT